MIWFSSARALPVNPCSNICRLMPRRKPWPTNSRSTRCLSFPATVDGCHPQQGAPLRVKNRVEIVSELGFADDHSFADFHLEPMDFVDKMGTNRIMLESRHGAVAQLDRAEVS